MTCFLAAFISPYSMSPPVAQENRIKIVGGNAWLVMRPLIGSIRLNAATVTLDFIVSFSLHEV